MQQASKESNNIPLAALQETAQVQTHREAAVQMSWEVMFCKARKQEKAAVLPLILNKMDFKLKKKLLRNKA